MINMNLKEAIEQILPHYEKAVVEMPKEGHYEWLYKQNMERGICFFSKLNLNVNITGKMIRELGHSGLLHLESPQTWYTYEENLQQIQNRVDWMRKYLSKN